MSIEIAYHISHEQFAPSHLLRLAEMAEASGFDAIHSSDHFHPWSIRQGQSGFSFSWIGAAMQATTIPFSMVCAPGQRYHPAIVAQAIATLGEMFPGRFSIELGSGEALNERITGEPWPPKEIRNKRLLESASVIRRLLSGEEVSFEGYIKIKEAKLYTLPKLMPLLFCAALSVETSGWAGTWADGLLTTAGSAEEMRSKYEAFNNNGGEGKPVYMQYAFSYGHTREEAVKGAFHQWRSNIVSPEKLADLYKPEHFDKAAAEINMDEFEQKINIITSIQELFTKADELEKLGVTRIILHNINLDHEEFLKDFAAYRDASKG
jgi:coenzyme F420-dependent glucose-6-phosphate dehydrogenase